MVLTVKSQSISSEHPRRLEFRSFFNFERRAVSTIPLQSVVISVLKKKIAVLWQSPNKKRKSPLQINHRSGGSVRSRIPRT